MRCCRSVAAAAGTVHERASYIYTWNRLPHNSSLPFHALHSPSVDLLLQHDTFVTPSSYKKQSLVLCLLEALPAAQRPWNLNLFSASDTLEYLQQSF